MTEVTWSASRLDELATAEELVLVVSRVDRAPLRVPVWPVVVDGCAYVRSYTGVTSGWYRGVIAEPHQAVALGEGDVAVIFETVDRADGVNGSIDAAFLGKYSRFDYRDAMVEPAAVDATLRIVPAQR